VNATRPAFPYVPAPNRTDRPGDARVARSRAAPRRSGAGGTLVGIFIGLVLGLGLAAGVAFYVTGGWKTYRSQIAAGKDSHDAKEPAKVAKADADKPRFDFYKILPGHEEPKVQPERKPPEKPADRAVADKAAERSSGKAADAVPAKPPEKGADAASGPERVASAAPSAKAATGEKFWLQAGSFSTEPDAENLKARLALAGWEASVQQGVLADKSVRYRVRLGPYDNADELNRIKGELGRRGFDVAVIKY
jgi:cell division protein FtsN